MSDDFPTLDRPMKANSGSEDCGAVPRLTADFENVAEWILMDGEEEFGLPE